MATELPLWSRISKLLEPMEKETAGSYLRGNLPPSLERFQHFDQEIDDRAARIIKSYYSDQKRQELQDDLGQAERLVERLNLYRKAVFQDIYRASDHRLILSLPENGFSVSLTAQNKEVLIFILHLDQATHLTLELIPTLDNKKEFILLGMPPRLGHDDPYLSDLILADILHPLLNKLKAEHPNIELDLKTTIFDTNTEQVLPDIPLLAGTVEYKYQPPLRQKRDKVPKVLTPIAQYLSSKVDLPEPHEQQRRKFFVIHSRSKVKSLLGERIPENIIDRVMEEIRDFEFGRSEFDKKLEDVGNLWELRAGQYRIIFRHNRGRVYSLVAVGDRKDIFRRENIFPATAKRA